MKATTYQYVEYKPKGNVFNRFLVYSEEVEELPKGQSFYQFVSYNEYKITYDDVRSNSKVCRLWYKEEMWNQKEKELIVHYFLSTTGLSRPQQ